MAEGKWVRKGWKISRLNQAKTERSKPRKRRPRPLLLSKEKVFNPDVRFLSKLIGACIQEILRDKKRKTKLKIESVSLASYRI